MRYGLQLYSVRDAMRADFEGTLKYVASVGYESVEFAGFFGRTPEQVNAVLEETGLRLSGTHSSWEDLSSSPAHSRAQGWFYYAELSVIATPEHQIHQGCFCREEQQHQRSPFISSFHHAPHVLCYQIQDG